MPSLNDLAYEFYKNATGWDTEANPPSNGGLIVAPFDSNSLNAAGVTAVDHTAGLQIVSLAAPPAGLYEVFVQITTSAGTPVAIDAINYEFRVAGTGVLRFAHGLANSPTHIRAQRRLNGSDACSLNCVAVGTAGVRVAGSITLTKVAN